MLDYCWELVCLEQVLHSFIFFSVFIETCKLILLALFFAFTIKFTFRILTQKCLLQTMHYLFIKGLLHIKLVLCSVDILWNSALIKLFPGFSLSNYSVVYQSICSYLTKFYCCNNPILVLWFVTKKKRKTKERGYNYSF